MNRKCLSILSMLVILVMPLRIQAQGDIRGYYVGDFVATNMNNDKHPMFVNKINISIDAINGDKVRGHSVVAGNYRPFAGTFTRQGALYRMSVREPGDDRYDGKFDFALDAAAREVTGTWTANDKNLAVPKREYLLKKTVFQYNAAQSLEHSFMRRGVLQPIYETYDRRTGKSEAITADAWKFNASTHPLRSSDVENMYKRDLEVMRNAIYARHGYSFQNREMRYLFDHITWYVPVSVDVTRQLTDLERRNIEILKRYENHAARYYDRFGR